MERSPLAWLVILLLAVPSAHALCGVSQIPLSQYNRFEVAIHDSNGAIDFNTLRSLFPAKVSKLDVNSTVIADPSMKSYYVDDFNGYAADPKTSDLFINRSTSKGAPFLIAGVVASEMRIAKDTPNGPGYGEMLHEHYTGRAETSVWNVQGMKTAASAMYDNFKLLTGMESILSHSPRIVNVLRSGDFNVVIVCASNICNQEVYSLFTKYLNIGTSSEMFAEFGITSMWNKVLPSSFKRSVRATALKIKSTTPVSKFIDKWNVLAEHVPGVRKIETFQDQIMNDVAKQSDDVKQAYVQCLLTNKCSGLEDAKILEKLTPEQKARLARALTESSVALEDLSKVLSSPEVRAHLDDALRAMSPTQREQTVVALKTYDSLASGLDDAARQQLDDILERAAKGEPVDDLVKEFAEKYGARRQTFAALQKALFSQDVMERLSPSYREILNLAKKTGASESAVYKGLDDVLRAAAEGKADPNTLVAIFMKDTGIPNSPELKSAIESLVSNAKSTGFLQDYVTASQMLGESGSLRLQQILAGTYTGELSQSQAIASLQALTSKPLNAGAIQALLQNPEEVKNLVALRDFYSALQSADHGSLEIIAKQLEGAGYPDLAKALTAKDFTTFADTLSNMPDEDWTYLRSFFANARSTSADVQRASTELQKIAPLDFGLAGATREWTADLLQDGALRRVFKEGVVVPGLMYIVRSGFLQTSQQIPGAVVGFSNLGALAGPYHVPKEWKFTRIAPTEGQMGDDAFVDILIGGGSDPGDFFKTVLSIFPWSMLEDTVFHGHQPGIMSAFVVGKQQERMYEMGPSLVSLAVAEKSCPTCTLSSLGNGHFVFSAQGASVTGSVVEAQRDNIGATSIVFAHHDNIDFGDASVDIAKAATDGEACEQKCTVVRSLRKLSGNLLGDPTRAAFVATFLESLGYTAFGPGFLVFDMPIQMKLYGGCHDCVDTWGGYYIHSFVPYVKQSDETSILANNPSASITDAIHRLIPVASLGSLGNELNKFASKLKANELEKGAPYVDFYLNNFDSGELLFTKLVSVVMGPGEQMPSKYSEQGSIVLGKGGHRLVINTKNGTVSMDGNTLISAPDHVRLYSVDPEVPGIVIPATLVVTSFAHSPAITAHSRADYSFDDNAFISCVKSHFADLNAGDITLKEAFGDIIEVHTTTGQIAFGKTGSTATTQGWSGKMSVVDVDGADKSYAVEGDAVDFGIEGNELTLKTNHKVLGMLDSVVFQNGVIIRKGNYLLVWRKWLVRVVAQDIGRVDMIPNEKNGTVLPQFVPKPDASPQTKQDVKRLNELIKQMGGITAVDAQHGYFQLFDKNGQLWMRYYDADTNKFVEAPVTGMHQDPNDPSTFIVDTPKGQYRVSLPIDSNGAVHLKIDGKDLGIVTRMQGPNGALIYDPNNGTWSLLNGLIAGLSKAFSNGIKISFNGAGYANMTPANYSNIYRNISPMSHSGISLPLLDGWEVAALLVALAAVYAITR
ncbi:MAG: hypothetical protein GXN93_05020 [Candidatus Diapherotrites archaeon]|nr:hypothetical protein [Candidatus Diapherotrites archaeon]